MMNFHNSQVQINDQIHSQKNQLQESSSLARRLDDQKASQITQYFNVNNQNFQNLEHTSRNPKLQSDRSDNTKLQMFSSFPEEKIEHKNFLLNPRSQNVKESRIEQSLQKAFNLNRSTHRIPFKKKQSPIKQKIGLSDAFQGYNFYHPSYNEYFPKQHRKFWIDAFQKFYDKRGSLQTMEFPSFQSKDQSKSYEHIAETHKKSHESENQQKSSSKERINHLMGRCSWINTVLLVVILIVGLIILIKK